MLKSAHNRAEAAADEGNGLAGDRRQHVEENRRTDAIAGGAQGDARFWMLRSTPGACFGSFMVFMVISFV
jgi:hypothetical protein